MSEQLVPLQSYLRANERCVELLAQVERLTAALACIVTTFTKDEMQGYRSRDRQFAIEIARRALEGKE